jgi:insertion element IS1 protein InsB
LIEGQITIAKSLEEQTENSLEIDEMWHYIQNKESKCWIWIAICKVTKLIFGYVTGSRVSKTGKLLFDKLVSLVGVITATTIFYTDWWEPYTKFITQSQHYQGKRGSGFGLPELRLATTIPVSNAIL